MFQTVKKDAFQFSLGIAWTAAYVADRLTGDRFDLTSKVNKAGREHRTHIWETNAMECGTAASLAVIWGTTAMGIGTAMFHAKDAVAKQVTQRAEGNAQTGTQKVQEAASAAGIIVPKLQGGPQ